jgi:hypothetical protein
VADLAAALAARETAVGQKTHKNKAQAWDQYTKWCEQCGLGNNRFLNGLSRQHKIEIMGAFAVAIREGRFSWQSNDTLAQKSVSDTLNFVAATFQEHRHEDPKKDVDNNVARLLCQQLRSYKKDNPKSVEQKALPLCTICLILSNRSTELQQAMGNLTVATHFWAIHSCKYLKVMKAEQQQTKQLCLRNIAFIKNGKILDHSSTKLHLVDCISVTFERQKNNRKSDRSRSGEQKIPSYAPWKYGHQLSRKYSHTKEQTRTHPSLLSFTGWN